MTAVNYVALVRGVAPSTPPRDNTSIVEALGTLGFAGVQSVLSSGNYIFRTDAAPDSLEDLFEATFVARLGVKLLTIVRSREQLQRLVDGNPLAGLPHGRGSYQLVTFFKQPVDLGSLPATLESGAVRLVGSVDGALFSVTDNTAQQTTSFMTWLEHRYTRDITSRTPATLQRILARMKQPEPGRGSD